MPNYSTHVAVGAPTGLAYAAVNSLNQSGFNVALEAFGGWCGELLGPFCLIFSIRRITPDIAQWDMESFRLRVRPCSGLGTSGHGRKAYAVRRINITFSKSGRRTLWLRWDTCWRNGSSDSSRGS